jgi:hypothetical protein
VITPMQIVKTILNTLLVIVIYLKFIMLYYSKELMIEAALSVCSVARHL